MCTLIIDTASAENMVALYCGSKKIAEKKWQPNCKESEQLLFNIEMLLKKEKKEWRDLAEIRVHNGPGGFTRVRVGVTTANALSYALDIPIGILGSKTKPTKNPITPKYGKPPSISISKKK